MVFETTMVAFRSPPGRLKTGHTVRSMKMTMTQMDLGRITMSTPQRVTRASTTLTQESESKLARLHVSSVVEMTTSIRWKSSRNGNILSLLVTRSSHLLGMIKLTKRGMGRHSNLASNMASHGTVQSHLPLPSAQ